MEIGITGGVFDPGKRPEIIKEIKDGVNELDATKLDIKMGPMLELDAAKETFIGETATPEALALLTREYRAGYEVPQVV